MDGLYTTKEAAKYLGIAVITLNLYLADKDMPINGELLNPRTRVFKQDELDTFKEYLNQHPAQRGYPWHKFKTPGEFGQQQIADNMVNMLRRVSRLKKEPALQAIQNFERCGWYPEVFEETLPATMKLTARGIVYSGKPADLVATIDRAIAAYIAAVDEGGGTINVTE